MLHVYKAAFHMNSILLDLSPHTMYDGKCMVLGAEVVFPLT